MSDSDPPSASTPAPARVHVISLRPIQGEAQYGPDGQTVVSYIVRIGNPIGSRDVLVQLRDNAGTLRLPPDRISNTEIEFRFVAASPDELNQEYRAIIVG